MTKYINPKTPGFFKVLAAVTRMGISASRRYFGVFVLLNVLNGVLTGLYAPLLNRFFDAAAGGGSLSTVLMPLIAFAAVLIGEHVVNGTDHSISADIHLSIRGDGWARVADKAARVSAEWFEDPAFLLHLDRAREGARYDWTFFIPLLRFVALYLPTTIVVGAYLFTLGRAYPFLLLLIYVPTAFTYFVRARFLEGLEGETAHIRRERAHDKDCCAGGAFFKETRTLGAHRFFIGKFEDSTARLVAASKRTNKRAFAYELSSAILTALGYAGVLLILLRALRRGELSAGAFAAVFTTLNYFFMLADETIGHMLAPTNGIATVKHFVSFLTLKEDAERAGTGDQLIAENVSYSYPGASRRAVDGVSLGVKRAETVAVVGLNGSGKTTLVKLLTGLYAPDEGKVTLMGRASAVFQHVERYPMTLLENVTIADSEGGGDAAACLSESAIPPTDPAFPDGLNTMLGREFGGAELSGGQWQRVAIARGLYRSSDMIVLDEPTAAIDPIEETRIYEQFKSLAKGRAAILVTHRLGSARIADRIIVMDGGRIAEEGTHEELLAQNGLYRELLTAQAKWYA